MRKILRINLETESWKLEDTLADLYGHLGGRGLTSKIIRTEVPPRCDPLGKENKLVFAAGLLAGTSAPNSGRLSVGAKSPLTGTIKEANSGGAAAHKLARLGIQAVVVEGVAAIPTCLKIDASGVTFLNATNLEMLGNYELIRRLRGELGENIGIISIGTAGAMRLLASTVSVTTPDFHVRSAARGGLGAVMGSKNLKAVVIDDTGCQAVQPEDKELFTASVKALSKGIASHPLIGGLRMFGTPLLVNLVNEMGGLVTKNYSLGRFAGAEKISGEYIAELLKARPEAKTEHRCMPGCIVSCSNVFTGETGRVVVSGLEYETIAMMGSNCMIDDIDVVAAMNGICNDIGVDTMDVGGAIAVCMEAGMIPWGDGKAALKLADAIASGSENGQMVGNGCRFTGNKLGVRRIPHVKGQSLAGYDPRVLKGTGVTYATSPMGADHTCGNALPSPANPDYNPSAPKGQGDISRFLQTYMAAVDTLGLCLFASLPTLEIPELQKEILGCVSGLLGISLEPDYLMRLGQSVLQTETSFNTEAGFTKIDDRLPQFFLEEKIMPSGNTFDVSEEDLDAVHTC